jgi:flagellar motor protein MotB
MRRYEDTSRRAFRVYFDMAMIIGLSITGLWAATQMKNNKLFEKQVEWFQRRLAGDRMEIEALRQETDELGNFLRLMGEPVKVPPSDESAVEVPQIPAGEAGGRSAQVERYMQALTSTAAQLERTRQYKSGLWSGLEKYLRQPVRIVYGEDSLHFDSGKATLRDNYKTNLTRRNIKRNSLENVGKGYNFIQVEGHTDNDPIAGRKYSDNWELSAARAITIAREIDAHLAANGKRRNRDYLVVASGFSEYHPIAPNWTEKGKQENRRIEITFLYRPLEEGNR